MKQLPLILIADNIRSLYNVGSLFRLADGVNIEALYLCGLTGYPRTESDSRPSWVAERADKEIRKTGLSGVDSIPFTHFESTAEAVQKAREAGYQIVVLEESLGSIDYRHAEYRFPVAVIVGHEVSGVADDLLQQADTIVHLPMRGQGKSLNVATATSAFLYYLNDRYENS